MSRKDWGVKGEREMLVICNRTKAERAPQGVISELHSFSFHAEKCIQCKAACLKLSCATGAGWQWFAWDALPGEELLFWSLRDLRRENLIDLSLFE